MGEPTLAHEAELATLEAKGLIRLATYQPELEYLFRHWLIQDAAYGSLLKQERRELHRRVGEALEVLYPDRRRELAAVLALHFEQAGATDKAIEYYVEAGTYGLERNAVREAFAAFDRAMALLPPLGDTEGDALRRRRVTIAIGRARAGWTFLPMEDEIVDLEAILPEAERLDDPELIAPIHLLLALQRLMYGQPASDPVVRRSLNRIGEIGDRLEDPSLRAMPLALIGLQQVFSGPIRDGVRKLEEAVPLLEDRHDPITAAFARGALAIGYANLGEFDKAEEASRRATEIAANGDLVAQLDAQIAESMLRSMRGQLDEAVPLARACVERAEETGASACVVASSWVLGDAYARLGRFAEASDTLRRGNEIALVVDRKIWRPTLTAWLGSAMAALGATTSIDDPALADAARSGLAGAEGPVPIGPPPDDAWDDALRVARSIGNRYGEAGILWKRGEAHVRRGDLEAAVPDFELSATIAEAEGARPNLARILRAWGESLRALGRTEESDAKLRRSLALFQEMRLDGEAAAIRATLALRHTD